MPSWKIAQPSWKMLMRRGKMLILPWEKWSCCLGKCFISVLEKVMLPWKWSCCLGICSCCLGKCSFCLGICSFCLEYARSALEHGHSTLKNAPLEQVNAHFHGKSAILAKQAFPASKLLIFGSIFEEIAGQNGRTGPKFPEDSRAGPESWHARVWNARTFRALDYATSRVVGKRRLAAALQIRHSCSAARQGFPNPAGSSHGWIQPLVRHEIFADVVVDGVFQRLTARRNRRRATAADSPA